MLWGITGYSVGRPHNLGLKNNMLEPCPSSPNCVLSQASDAKHSRIHHTLAAFYRRC